jgi:dTDP-4-amino-4,6-dideoxygalactose transaminase
MYSERLGLNPKITVPVTASYSNHVFHQYTLLLDNVDRDGLNSFLAANQIPSMIYYPVPAHRQKMFEGIFSTMANALKASYLGLRALGQWQTP